MSEKDYLGLHLRSLPYFRALVRANEARFYQGLDLPGPVLDVGCGDGHFASLTFEQPIEVGIDPWGGPIRAAKQYGVYQTLIQGDAGSMPFPDGYFGSALSNSVLEHIPYVDAVVAETARVLKPGAPFVFCVPNQQFLDGLSLGRALKKVGLKGLAGRYEQFFNRISRHQHCNSPEVWRARLKGAGFEIERWWHYMPPEGLAVVEWGHLFGLPALAAKALFGRWILAEVNWNLSLTRRLVERYYGDQILSPAGVYTFYIARKRQG